MSILKAEHTEKPYLVLADQDVWEDVVNPTLDHVLGFGRSTDSLHALIRRGKYGAAFINI